VLRAARDAVPPRYVRLADHAHGGDPARDLRSQPLDRAVADQGLLRGAEGGLRRSLSDRGAQGHAAVADRARRGDETRARRRLLAVWIREAPPDVVDVPALLVRAGTLDAVAAAGGAFRARGAGVGQDLMGFTL